VNMNTNMLNRCRVLFIISACFNLQYAVLACPIRLFYAETCLLFCKTGSVYTFSLAHEHDEDMVDIAESISASDEFQLLQTIRLKQKITSFSFCPAEPKKGTLGSIGLALHNNSLEVHELQEESTSRVHSIEISGHRSDVRVAALSTDSTTLMTASHNAVKICVCCCTGLLPYKFRIQSYNIQSSNFGFFGCR
jgi:hypothetical protein